MDMAWSLQSSIEETFYSQASLAGASMDLTKAFNLIPRDGFQAIACQLGWPNTLLRAHDAFLRGLNRFFCFGGTLHRPTSSSVGVPEGCPISVAAMMVITWVADARMRAMTHVSLHSYVDNWSVQHSDANIVLQATANAVETIESLAMSMSFDKLKMYATDVKARKFLRASQISGHSLQVVHDFKDLGFSFVLFSVKQPKGSMSDSKRCSTVFKNFKWFGGLTFVKPRVYPESSCLEFCMGLSWCIYPLVHFASCVEDVLRPCGVVRISGITFSRRSFLQQISMSHS